MSRANHVAGELFARFNRECKRLAANRNEMAHLSESYFRYLDLLHEQEQVRTRILKIFGVLGVHSPEVSPSFAKLISPVEINSDEVRRELKIWEILELFLSALDDKATVSDFKSFLCLLDIKATSQAIESAIKAHPELFAEHTKGQEKFLTLRKGIVEFG